MDRVKKLTEARRASILDATNRAAKAEETAEKLQSALKEKAQMERELQKRLDLSRQQKQLTKELVISLQKLDEAKTKLEIVSQNANILEIRIQKLRAETDDFESRYQTARKQHNEMIIELEHLGIN